MGRAGGNGGIGCTKGREAQLHEAAADGLIRGIVSYFCERENRFHIRVYSGTPWRGAGVETNI